MIIITIGALPLQPVPICGIAGENRPSGAKTKNELFIPCCSSYLALSSGACGASIRASVPEL